LRFPKVAKPLSVPALKEKAPQAQVTSIQQYFCKLGQLLINTLDSVTADGFCVSRSTCGCGLMAPSGGVGAAD